MAVHLLKVCVGVEAVDQLRAFQARRLAAGQKLRHVTRHRPRRAAELLDGGSLYWIIRNVVRVRQRVVDLETVRDELGTRCGLVLDAELVEVTPFPRRPHQGWRYLEDKDAPPDLARRPDGLEDMPDEMAAELRALGLL